MRAKARVMLLYAGGVKSYWLCYSARLVRYDCYYAARYCHVTAAFICASAFAVTLLMVSALRDRARGCLRAAR